MKMRPDRNSGIARKGVRRTAIAGGIAFAAMIALLCAGPIETKTIYCSFVISPVRWLARHQNHDGSWGDPESPPAERVRLTGMSLLNFASAGYTHMSRDQFDGICYGTVVKEGLMYLIKRPLLDTLRNEPDDYHLYGSWCQAREDLDRQHPGIPDAKANAIRDLIGRWESDRWTDREGASLELIRLGPDAKPFLEQATNQPDPEAQARARQAIRMICRPRQDPAHIETTCLNSLSLMLYFRYLNSFGVYLCQ